MRCTGCSRVYAPAASVCNAIGECLHAACLMVSSETALVTFSISSYMLVMLQLQFFHMLDNDGIAAALARLLRADVGVAAGAIPVARHGLRIKTAKR